MPTVGPAFDPGPAGAPVEPLPMLPTPPVVGLDPLCEGGMLPIAPDERAVPVPLAELLVPAVPAPDVGQSALDAAPWPALPLPVRSGGQFVAPLLPAAPEVDDPALPEAPDEDDPDPVLPGSTELPEPMVPALMPEVLLPGVWATATDPNASAAAAANADSVSFMMIPLVNGLPMLFARSVPRCAMSQRP